RGGGANGRTLVLRRTQYPIHRLASGQNKCRHRRRIREQNSNPLARSRWVASHRRGGSTRRWRRPPILPMSFPALLRKAHFGNVLYVLRSSPQDVAVCYRKTGTAVVSQSFLASLERGKGVSAPIY